MKKKFTCIRNQNTKYECARSIVIAMDDISTAEANPDNETIIVTMKLTGKEHILMGAKLEDFIEHYQPEKEKV